MAANPIFVGTWRPEIKTIDDSYSTRPAKIFTAGSSGSRVHQASFTSTDNANIDAKLYYIEQLTSQADMGTATHVDGGGGSDTLTRTTGSFITDGWKVGDILFVHGSTTRANDYIIELTGVAALTLTFATGTVNTGEVLPSGGVLYRAAQLGWYDIPADSGNADATAAIDLLDDSVNPMFDASPDRYIIIGANDGLALQLQTAVGSGEQIDTYVGAGDY